MKDLKTTTNEDLGLPGEYYYKRDKLGDEAEPLKENAETKKCKDFEEVLNLCGSEGAYQKTFLFLVLCPIVTVAPFLVLNNIFMLDIPDHWCHVPGNGADGDSSVFNASSSSTLNYDMELWKNMTLPMEEGPDGQLRFSQCKMYSLGSVDGGDFGETRPTTDCQFGWEFDKSDYESTIPSEFNWVCDKVHYATDCFTWSNVGSAVGTVVFGISADKYGRKPVFFVSCFFNIFFRTVALFVPQHLELYLFLMFLSGSAFPAIFSMPALIAAEICSASYRAKTYAVTWMIWVVGNSLLPFAAWITKGWFLLGCISAISGSFLFLYHNVVDESPRWLISVGDEKRAVKILLKAAKKNGKTVSPNVITRMVSDLVEKQEMEKRSRNIGVWTLFQKFRLARNTVMLCIAWSMNCILYYGVTLNTTSMAGNRFLNYFLLSIIELPSGWLAGFLVEKTGRRWTQVGFFMVNLISCVICVVAVANPDVSVLEIIGALGIKFGVTITSLVVYLQGAEIFPTQLRSTGSGLASTISSCLGVAGPYIVFTGKIDVILPYAILGIVSAIGILSSSFLPETFRQSLPETIKDANDFGKDKKFWSYIPKDDKHTRRSIIPAPDSITTLGGGVNRSGVPVASSGDTVSE